MINILIRTDSRYPVNREIIKRAIRDTLKKHKFEDLPAEISVAVVGSRKMGEISKKYLNDDLPHEVLSFALEEMSAPRGSGFVNPSNQILHLGDIILCWPYVLKAASLANVMVDYQVYLLTSHGLEHLLGNHH